ncbi:RING finger protein 32 [Tetrabaena socialis]|uniref:RING finger protein 32 n=1 Tax=Tetrabaena socialis TaxID=47790 RepID=A0A2J7ZZD0_9CHLO|nr:RING finger protein 32 [Tetrabaena socialis]|eukprot:PNH05629.1 RING finger protein 32 [Tetrabaena socialis]
MKLRLASNALGAQMTLAQHLGLIPRPPPLLTEDQWTEVHLRSRLRQDSAAECVICKEEFQAGAQVLLSCSHTFHRHCLAAFERYSRCKSCPLCRAEQYQKRVIRDGEQLFRDKCATRIQAAWRGFAARRRYRQLRRHTAPRDERLRRKWAAERLQASGGRHEGAGGDGGMPEGRGGA